MITNELTQTAANILNTLTGRSSLPTEAWVYLACGGVGFILVLRFAGAAFNFQRNTIIVALLGSLLAGAIIGASMYALHVFAVPHIGETITAKTLLFAGAIAATLVVVLPLFMLFYKAGYLRVGLVVALAVAAAVGCTVLARGGHKAFLAGNHGLDGAREHRRIIEDVSK